MTLTPPSGVLSLSSYSREEDAAQVPGLTQRGPLAPLLSGLSPARASPDSTDSASPSSASEALLPSTLRVLITSCVPVIVLLFPCPKLCFSSAVSHIPSGARGHHRGPLALLSLSPSWTRCSWLLQEAGASQGLPEAAGLVAVTPALLQPPPAPVGLCVSTPSSTSPLSSATPPHTPKPGREELNFT